MDSRLLNLSKRYLQHFSTFSLLFLEHGFRLYSQPGLTRRGTAFGKIGAYGYSTRFVLPKRGLQLPRNRGWRKPSQDSSVAGRATTVDERSKMQFTGTHKRFCRERSNSK